MLAKGIHYIIFAFWGIITKRGFSIKVRLLLLVDYINLLVKLTSTVLFKTKYQYVTIRAFGLKIYFYSFYTFFFLFSEIFCMGVYSVLENVNSFVDIGANIGLSILWYSLFNHHSKIIAFEPNQEYIKYLKKNLRVNHIKNVTIYPLCLSNKKGVSKFYLIDHFIQSLNSGLALNRKLPYRVMKVKTDLLSNYIDKPVSLIKIDVEGAEYDILEDLFSTKKINLVDNIVYEAHFCTRYQISGYKRTIKKLSRLGHVDSQIISELTRVNYFKKK